MPEIYEFLNTPHPSGKQLSLGIDDDARLYVNGEHVITEQKVRLDGWLNFVLALGSLGAFAQGLAAVVMLWR